MRYTYSRWDGTQRGFEPDADDILAAVTDDLIEHGDVNAALRRLMNDGLRSANGDAIAGLRELLQRLRQARRDRLERFDLRAQDVAPAPGNPLECLAQTVVVGLETAGK